MKNINSIISKLSKTGLWSKESRALKNASYKSALTDTLIGQAIGKNRSQHSASNISFGGMSAVSEVAWQAYQLYFERSRGLNSSLNKANMQRAYMLGVHSQRNAEKKNNTQELSEQNKQNTATNQKRFYDGTDHARQNEDGQSNDSVSRYIPSSKQQNFTYSKPSLNKQHFDEVALSEVDGKGPLLLFRAMVAAANADGHIDEFERERILAQVKEFGLDKDVKAKLFDELLNPMSIEQLVEFVQNEQTAIEVYSASLLTLDYSKMSSQSYLKNLASVLSLPSELVTVIHRQLNQV